jgi:hypothetical protein
MTKLLLIISIVALLGSGAISFLNRQSLVKNRDDKDKINAEIAKILEEKGDPYVENAKKLKEDLDAVKRTLAENEATLELTTSNMTTAKREIETEKAKEGPLVTEIQKFNKLLSDLQAKFPGMKAPDIAAKIEELKKSEKSLTEEQEALLAEVDVLAKRADANMAEVQRLEEKQLGRAVGIARNSAQATITAINQDWGFAVFNAGEDMGVSLDSKLYIKRGTQILGRLKVISVEPRLTVANIDAKSVRDGATIMPGDKVIFGNVQE